MSISRGYLPAVTGEAGPLISAAYRVVLLAVKQEGVDLDVRHVTTEKERIERDPAVIYWHKALVEGVDSRSVDLSGLSRCFPEKILRSGTSLAAYVQESYSKLPSLLINRLLVQTIACACGAHSSKIFPMSVPAQSELRDFLERVSSTCPVCKRTSSLHTSRVPILIFAADQGKSLRISRDARRAATFSGLIYLTVGVVFAVQETGSIVSASPGKASSSTALVLRTATVNPLSGESELYGIDGRVDREGTEALRSWLDGTVEEIDGLTCIGIFLLNRQMKNRKRTPKRGRRNNRKNNAPKRPSKHDCPDKSDGHGSHSSYSSYSSSYDYSYDDSGDSKGSGAKGSRSRRGDRKEKERQGMDREGRRDRSRTYSRTPPSDHDDSHHIIAARVNREPDLYQQRRPSSQVCMCCGASTITAMWIFLGVLAGISILNFILICVLFSRMI